MRAAPIAARLVSQVPALGGRVWSALSGAIPPAYPAAYVLPLAERLQEQTLSGDHALYEVRLAVELMLKHAAEAASGGPAGEALADLREACMDALVGWRPAPDAGPLALAGGRLLSLEAGLAVWRDEYVYTLIR